MRVVVPRGSTSTHDRQSRHATTPTRRNEGKHKMCLLVSIRALFMETAHRKLGHLQKTLGPLQIVAPCGVYPRLSQLVCLLFDGLLFVPLRRIWELRVGEVLRWCDAVAKVYLFQVMFRDAMHEDVVS